MRRLALTLALASAVALPGAYALGAHMASPAPDAIVGTFPVPTGEVTVYGDHSARYAPTSLAPYFMGACAVDSMNDTTGLPHEAPVYLCAPAFAPDGYPVRYVDPSDGWARYPGSAWDFDGDAHRFVPADPAAILPPAYA